MFRKPPKNLKKSLLCQPKFQKVRMGKVKSSGGSQKNFKKSLLCPKKSQKVTFMSVGTCLQYICTRNPTSPGSQMRYVCSIRSNMCHRLRQQGGTQMRYVCSIRSNMCHMVEAAGWDPDAVHFRNWCLDVAKVFKKRGLDPVPF